MKVEHRLSTEAWKGYAGFLDQLLTETGAQKICEIGGGANPAIKPEVVGRRGLEYVVLDIAGEELAKAPPVYHKHVADVTKPGTELPAGCDLVFSKMLAEHVGDAPSFHANCLRMLRPGGRAFHFFPTLWAPPFILNWLVPESFSYWLLQKFQKGREREGNKGKFPARYQWCRGPTAAQLRRLESAGFEVERYIGFYGHEGYYQRRPFNLYLPVHRAVAERLRRGGWASLTSFAYAVLRKPAA